MARTVAWPLSSRVMVAGATGAGGPSMTRPVPGASAGGVARLGTGGAAVAFWARAPVEQTHSIATATSALLSRNMKLSSLANGRAAGTSPIVTPTIQPGLGARVPGLGKTSVHRVTLCSCDGVTA